ncbi:MULTISPECIES: hypothetical protein [Serratia]|uniref:hypothetical protein n=1 Tax=Serratia TaxID=613 RepID=UPI00217816D9|nr:hypothetical protein [Serratia liquefaciens]CAI1796307.1 Uncharacterised protein [Serratia liquefaciens]HEJ7947207.1 hypothetical protein [Serratia liquefaciens]
MRGRLLIAALISMVMISPVKSEEPIPENTILPKREVLLERFEKFNVVKKSEWKKGTVVDGNPVLTARFGGDVYTVNSRTVYAVSFTDSGDAKKDAWHSMEVCANLVSVVTGKNTKAAAKKVADILVEAANDKSLSSADLIEGYWFSTDIRTYDKVNALFCEVKGFTRWD